MIRAAKQDWPGWFLDKWVSDGNDQAKNKGNYPRSGYPKCRYRIANEVDNE